MKYYNISRFNRSNTSYLNDWTSIWEALDYNFDDELKWSQYLAVERNYLDFIIAFLQKNELDNFGIDAVEINLEKDTIEEFDKIRIGLLSSDWYVLSKLKKNELLTFLDKIALMQLALRGVLWFKFIDKKTGLYITFDRDFYLLIGVLTSNSIPEPSQFNLFLREMDDPWR